MSLMKSLWFVGNGQMELREVPIPVPKKNALISRGSSHGSPLEISKSA